MRFGNLKVKNFKNNAKQLQNKAKLINKMQNMPRKERMIKARFQNKKKSIENNQFNKNK